MYSFEIIMRENEKRSKFQFFATSPGKSSIIWVDTQEEAINAPLNEEEEYLSLGEYIGAHAFLCRITNVVM